MDTYECVNANSDLARFKKVLVQQLETAPASPSTAPKESVHGTPGAGATAAAAAASTIAAAATSSVAPAAAPAPTPPAVAAPTTTPTSSAAVITTTAAAAATADDAAGAPSVTADGDGVESEGEAKDSFRAPGRRSRWRRRFRRLLRRDRGREAAAPSAVAAGAEQDGS